MWLVNFQRRHHIMVVHCCTVLVHQLGVFVSALGQNHSANSSVLVEHMRQQHWNTSMCTRAGLSLKARWVSSYLTCASICSAHVTCKQDFGWLHKSWYFVWLSVCQLTRRNVISETGGTRVSFAGSVSIWGSAFILIVLNGRLVTDKIMLYCISLCK